MRLHTTSLGLAILVVFLCSLVDGRSELFDEQNGADTVVAEPLPDLLQPKRAPEIQALGHCYGPVTALGADWIEVGPGWEGPRDVTKKQPEDNKKARRLSVAGTLAGGDPDGIGREFTYRLSDLKVGDVVFADTCGARDGAEYCLTIIIRRRPGGKIPPLPADDLGVGFHLRYQAEQDWEEKGIPIPRKYLDKDGRQRWTKPPYPPVAPMPRPANP
jgi:hypothetical protein